jgi:DNA-binding IclR family transcriptional regulator
MKLVKDKYYAAIYRVRHNGHEIGQTEQTKGSREVAALIWDRRMQSNITIGTFANHEGAAEAVFNEWRRRNASAA